MNNHNTKHRINNRWQAAAVHLAISLLIFLAIVTVMLVLWYPGELLYAGGINGLRILVGVDLVLGPLLTLLVFNRQKKSLKMDLSIVALIQFVCLAVGLWLIYHERPAAQVLTHQGVYLMSYSDLKLYKVDLDSLENTRENIRENAPHPAAFMLDLPEDWTEIPMLEVTTEFTQERPFPFRDDLYLPFQTLTPADYQARIEKIRENGIQESDASSLPTAENCEWLPVLSQHTSGHVCMNLEQGIIKLSEHPRFFDF